jgi:hypothetical protein
MWLHPCPETIPYSRYPPVLQIIIIIIIIILQLWDRRRKEG